MLGRALREAAARLHAAGVPSPAVDARLIAAHLLGVGPMEVLRHAEGPVPDGFDDAVARRAAREPLQHILGTAPFGPLDLAVGPGVFIPRPETEVLADWGVRRLAEVRGADAPRVVDLCTGTGALALYVAHARADAEVAAVEKQEIAHAWARRNIAALAPRVRLVRGDATDAGVLADWHGTCDLVLTNPPYVPETGDLDPEVYADPHEAVFAGESGMDVIDAMLPTIHALLKDGGAVGIEHDDSTSEQVRQAVRAHGGFHEPEVLTDLTGRARFVTASKLSD
ncbi:peptide chain release factor N(5)-glutamine methyltransferase [Corynebacterium halotolerans]|uniref:Release factor glutamine methyltransferase n=1 Tax=Corynebacterium halotolerans YIM 70093 = DSM 44683 TaxID=1121362 RepID=M1MWV2_9CORY|nr:peptide chain release factor N(5)-glutamine methyltransferase [Corynebacterium halotolerans]AGF72229.1 N5-glutamine S-adenosyl-L-methionine-dependent methyltransferase [Corynebacterium halotolerans YIM 70093 = DSM 44683]